MLSFKKALSFIGPGFLIAVGYLDPGNWATDLAAGSTFQYSLLCVVLFSNLVALLMQYLSIKLGVVTNLDLAQACRKHFSFKFNVFLWIICEIAIIAMDLAEVIGTSIALKLLFGIPLKYGIILTALDVLVILSSWDSLSFQIFEICIAGVIFIVALCFILLLIKSRPDLLNVINGFLPSKTLLNSDALFLSLGIIGATVMPHNIYLHSHLVKFRAPKQSNDENETNNTEFVPYFIENDDHESSTSLDNISPLLSDSIPATKIVDKHHLNLLKESIKYSTLDSTFALTLALLVNSSILIVAGSEFFGIGSVSDIFQAHDIITKNLGAASGFAFAFALLLSGQSSTITGTIAGQVVMEGFLGSNNIKMKPWLRRLITRSLAIIPPLIIAIVLGDNRVNDMLVWSQVLLGMQLPFAIFPLVYFTSTTNVMSIVYRDGDQHEFEVHTEDFSNCRLVAILSLLVAILLSCLNAYLALQVIQDLF